MNDKPANRHRDLRSLIRDDAYAASFQSLGQYRTALLECVETAVQGEPVVDMPTLPTEQTKLSAGLNPRRWYTYAERIESAGGRVRADGVIEFDTADAVDQLVRAVVRDCYLAHGAPAVRGEPPRHPTTPSFLEYPSFDESANFDPVPRRRDLPLRPGRGGIDELSIPAYPVGIDSEGGSHD